MRTLGIDLLDAPFSIPAAFAPDHAALLARARALGPFPGGSAFVRAVAPSLGPHGAKLWRVTDDRWRRRVNVRSTLWAGPRGGAAFTATCLHLLARVDRPVWPWDDGILAETFPAGQLCAWGLPYQRYGRPEDAANRQRIVDALADRVAIGAHRPTLEANADAMDALLCALAAQAVRTGALFEAPEGPAAEGWIAVAR